MKPAQTSAYSALALLLLALTLGCGRSSGQAGTTGEDQSVGGPTAEGTPAAGNPQDGTSDDPRPRVMFETSAGDFTVVLHRDKVPRTVDNFFRYVDSRFYDGTLLHQVIAGYAVLGGGYTAGGSNPKDLVEKDGFESIRNEADAGLNNLRGTIAMAREPDRADSARCQFFFNLADNTSLDYVPEEPGVPVWDTAGYCAFGQVESGMEVLDRIGNTPVESRNGFQDVPVEPIVVFSVRRL